jgi:hypothetical protein
MAGPTASDLLKNTAPPPKPPPPVQASPVDKQEPQFTYRPRGIGRGAD